MYLITFLDPVRTFHVSELTISDHKFADVGLSVIVRLADLHYWKNKSWAPLPAGTISTPSDPDLPSEPYHDLL